MADNVVEKPHLESKTLTEHIEYPGHEPRTESAEYRHNRHILIERLKLGCWICGTNDKLETHHWFEWSLWNDLDEPRVLPALQCFDVYGFGHHKEAQPVESPDDIRNLVVLCEEHHRGAEKGIHCLEHPVWLAQRAVKSGMSITETTAPGTETAAS